MSTTDDTVRTSPDIWPKPETCRELLFERLAFVKAFAESGMIYTSIAYDIGTEMAIRHAVNHLQVALDLMATLEEAKQNNGERP